MSLESTEILTDGDPGYALLPPQTVDESTGIVVDDVRAVDPSYGGLLDRHSVTEAVATIEAKQLAEATMSPGALNREALGRRQDALSWASTIHVNGDPVEKFITDAKAIEAYILGE